MADAPGTGQHSLPMDEAPIPPLMVTWWSARWGSRAWVSPFPARSCWSVPRCCRRTPSWPSTHRGVGGVAVIGCGDSMATDRPPLRLSSFDRLGRRFLKHFGPGHVALAERLFNRWESERVLGRFNTTALLRDIR